MQKETSNRSAVVSVFLAVIAIVVAIATPETRCFLGLDLPTACAVPSSSKSVLPLGSPFPQAPDRSESQRAAPAKSKQLTPERATEVTSAKDRFDGYISQESAGPNAIAVLIVGQDRSIDVEIGSALATELGGSASVFRATLVKDGLFDDIRHGDAGKLTALGVQRFARTVIFGVANATANSLADRHPDLISVESRISATILRENGSLATIESVAVGAGFSRATAEAKAREQSIKILIDRARARLASG